MVWQRAMPAAAPRVVGGGLGDLIEQRGEVGADEDVIDAPSGAALFRIPMGSGSAWASAASSFAVSGRAGLSRRASFSDDWSGFLTVC